MVMKKVSKQKIVSVIAGCTLGVSIMTGAIPVVASNANIQVSHVKVIEDFEKNVSANSWKKIDGWQYDNELNIAVDTINQTKALKIEVDYTGNEEISWSEAKIFTQFEAPYVLENSNYFTMDFYYPSNWTSFSIKLFSNDVMDQEATILETEEIGNGYTKAKLAIECKPTEKTMKNLTIGIVGKNTGFKGTVYLDNLTFGIYDEINNFVKITEIPKAGSVGNLNGLPKTVKIADSSALAC